MGVALRMDLREPVPLRRTPEFLFGDVRRRVRRAAAVSGVTLALVLGGVVWLARQDGGLRNAVSTPTVAIVQAATGMAAAPPAEEFPLIRESPSRSAAPAGDRASESDKPPGLLQPLPRAVEKPPVDQRQTDLAPHPEATEPPPMEPRQTPPAPMETVPPETTPPITSQPAPPPAEHPNEPRPTVPQPAKAAPTVYVLQLGTYRLEQSALDDQRHYRSLGMDTVIERHGGYFVLRLPPFATQIEAEREEARLREQGIKPLFIPPTTPEE